jgi:hypothetical protein
MTTYKTNILSDDEATQLYGYLESNVRWETGVRSRQGFTRLAKALEVGEIDLVDEVVAMTLSALTYQRYQVLGVYLNYYKDGQMWTPNHSHPGSHKIVISLGARRPLIVGDKSYEMANGSAIIFGSALHGVPKVNALHEGRISIAVFLKPF